MRFNTERFDVRTIVRLCSQKAYEHPQGFRIILAVNSIILPVQGANDVSRRARSPLEKSYTYTRYRNHPTCVRSRRRHERTRIHMYSIRIRMCIPVNREVLREFTRLSLFLRARIADQGSLYVQGGGPTLIAGLNWGLIKRTSLRRGQDSFSSFRKSCLRTAVKESSRRFPRYPLPRGLIIHRLIIRN